MKKIVLMPFIFLKNFIVHLHLESFVIKDEDLKKNICKIDKIKLLIILISCAAIGYKLARIEDNLHLNILKYLINITFEPSFWVVIGLGLFYIYCSFCMINDITQSTGELIGLIIENAINRFNFQMMIYLLFAVCCVYSSFFISLFFICHETRYLLLILILMEVNGISIILFTELYFIGLFTLALINFLDKNISLLSRSNKISRSK